MNDIAKEPFTFSTRFSLSELTGLRAANIEQLLALIKEVPESSIYHHTHRFLQLHQELALQPGNDFAVWISDVLSEHELGEIVASIDIIQFASIQQLREKLISVIEDYVAKNPLTRLRFANFSKQFNFIKAVSFVIPTHYVVRTLKELRDALCEVTTSSLYFHIFEARLRQDSKTHDIANWIEHSLGDPGLARETARLDPYSYTMAYLREALVGIITKRMVKEYAQTR